MKIQVSSDFLYAYFQEHDLSVSMIANRMGSSISIINRSFRHANDRLGKPIYFSPANIARLNDALMQVAGELRQHTLTFGSDLTYTNKHGRTYDPALVEQIKALCEYFNLKGLTERLLGWNRTKWNFILSAPSSKIYGHITREDVDRINAELLSVAGVLSSYEVTESPDKQVDKPIKTKEEEPAQKLNEWDDTALDLWERYARFHRLFPDGLIAFSVNDGFTVCEEDARLLARIDTTLQPYTDPTTGHVTLYMDAAKWQQIRRAWDDGDEMVAETPMYAE